MILNPTGGGQRLQNLDNIAFGELQNPPQKGQTDGQWYEAIAEKIAEKIANATPEGPSEAIMRTVTTVNDLEGLVRYIRTDAFAACTALKTVRCPVCMTIESAAFYRCSALTTVSFPVCTTIGGNAFYGCSALTTASFPVCTIIYSYAFEGCTSLTTASFPACTIIYTHAFDGCSALTTVSFPVCKTIGSYAFSNCSSLTTASFPACTTIGSYAFSRCFRLISLYLNGSSVCTLSNSNAFSSTPIGGYSASAGQYGSIYVPASLLASYQAATNWTYFSSRFVGV